MNIRVLTKDDIEKCAQLYIRSYNRPPWNYNWSYEKAVKYLTEYIERSRFVGFVLCDGDEFAGATLGHSKTWWTNDLLYVDELFISPDKQRLGYGQMLLDHAEKYAKEQGFDVITLITNKYMPSMKFYTNINYIHAEQFVFLFKPL